MNSTNKLSKEVSQGATAFIGIGAAALILTQNAGRIYQILENMKTISAPLLTANIAGSIAIGAVVDAGARRLVAKIFKVTNPIILQTIGISAALLVNTATTLLLTSFKVITLATPSANLLIMVGAGSFLAYKFFNLTDVLSSDKIKSNQTPGSVEPLTLPPLIQANATTNTVFEKKRMLKEMVFNLPEKVAIAPVMTFIRTFFSGHPEELYQEIEGKLKEGLLEMLQKKIAKPKTYEEMLTPIMSTIKTQFARQPEQLYKEIEIKLKQELVKLIEKKDDEQITYQKMMTSIMDVIKTSFTGHPDELYKKMEGRLKDWLLDIFQKQKTYHELIKDRYDETMVHANANPMFAIPLNSFLSGSPTHCRWMAEEFEAIINNELEKLNQMDPDEATPSSENFLTDFIKQEADDLIAHQANLHRPYEGVEKPKIRKAQAWNPLLSKAERQKISKVWELYDQMVNGAVERRKENLPFYYKPLSSWYFSVGSLLFNDGIGVADWLLKTKLFESLSLWGLKKLENRKIIDTDIADEVRKYLPFGLKLIDQLAPSISHLYDWNYYLNHFYERKKLIDSETPLDRKEVIKMLFEFYSKVLKDVLSPNNMVDAVDNSLNSINAVLRSPAPVETVEQNEPLAQ